MRRKHLIVAGNVATVEIGDAQVEQDVKKIGEVEDGEVLAVQRVAQDVLNLAVDAKNPKRLHQQIEEE